MQELSKGVLIMNWAIVAFSCSLVVVLSPGQLMGLDQTGVAKQLALASCPSELEIRWNRWCATVSDDDIASACLSDDDTVALLAVWTRAARRVRRGSPTDVEIKQFLGFVEGRLRAPVPGRWSDCLENATRPQRDSDLTKLEIPRAAGLPAAAGNTFIRLQKSVSGTTFPSRAETSDTDQVSIDVYPGPKSRPPIHILKIEDIDLEIPGREVTVNDSVGVGGAVMVKPDDQILVVCVGSIYRDTGFPILAFRPGQRNPIWTQRSWVSSHATGEIASAEIVIRGDRVVVFWSTEREIAIEGFSQKTGKCSFRFSTSYVSAATVN